MIKQTITSVNTEKLWHFLDLWLSFNEFFNLAQELFKNPQHAGSYGKRHFANLQYRDVKEIFLSYSQFTSCDFEVWDRNPPP